MIDIERISPNAHRMVIIGPFLHSDARRMIAFAQASAKAGGGGNLLIDITSLSDFSLAAISEELVHIPTLLTWLRTHDRIAVVSDEDWIRAAARLESALLPGVVYQVYDEDEADAARAWVMAETDSPHAGAFREIDVGNPAIAAFELSGRLDREQSERGTAMVRERLAAPDCTRLLLVIKRWHGFDADVLLSREVLAGKRELIGAVERYAIVGGPAWMASFAGIFGTMLHPEIRAFALDERDIAIKWLEM